MSGVLRSAMAHASPERVWAIWSDVSTWSRWNPNVVDFTLHGPFASGSSGVVTTRAGGHSNVTITALVPCRSFRLRWPALPGSHIELTGEITPRADGGTTIAQRIELNGALSRLWRPLLERRIDEWLEPSGLARYAEDAGH